MELLIAIKLAVDCISLAAVTAAVITYKLRR